VRVDASQLEQVLLNLYLNARDALEEAERLAPCIRTAARVALGARQGEGREGDYVCIEVSDNGTGMDAQTRERLFEPFFTTKEVGKGTGLGLATAYGILQRHQGWIECRSQEGQGTTFSLFLPAGERLEPAPAAAVAEGQAILPGGTETLLVIDDEELVRRSTARLFVSLGYRVLEAEDGLRGLDTFDRHREEIALVVLDLSMPGLSGRSVLRQLKARVPRLKVIVFTGYAAGAEEFAGLAQVVEKPFSVRRLAQIARQILDAG
jgi:CheY-like chemotaxis protein